MEPAHSSVFEYPNCEHSQRQKAGIYEEVQAIYSMQ